MGNLRPKNEVLSNFVSSVIAEITRYEKETKETYSDEIRKMFIDRAVEHRTDMSEYAFSMTNVEKLGVYPRQDHTTPAGVYFYPLTKQNYYDLLNMRLPYLADAKFVGLVKFVNLDDSKKWLILDRNVSYLTEDDVNEILLKLNFDLDVFKLVSHTLRPHLVTNDMRLYRFLTMYHDLAGKTLKDVENERKLYGLSLQNPISSNRILRKAGFVGVYDNYTSYIHPAEPQQAVCLVPSAYRIIDFFETAEVRRKIDYDAEVDPILNMSFDKKYELLNNRHLSPDILDRLSKDKEQKIKNKVVIHNKTSRKTLSALEKDDDPHVAKLANYELFARNMYGENYRENK